MKSPSSIRFSAAAPANGRSRRDRSRRAPRPCHSASRLSRSRIGGAHLKAVAPSANVVGGERQVVRTGLDGDRHAGSRAPRASAGERVGRREMDDVDVRAGTRAPSRMSSAIAACSLSGGRRRSQVRYSRGSRRRIDGSRSSAGNSACTSSGRPSAASTGSALAQICFADVLELVDARGRQEALEAEDAAPGERRERRRVARDHAAPEPDVDMAAPARGARLASKPATVVVAGMLLSGMSTSVVTPPAAAARVAVLEAFPVGPARIVDVDVGVDEARGARPDRRRRRRARRPGGRGALAIAAIRPSRDEDRRRPDAGREARRARRG